jgi:hypothetical protein
MSKGQQADIRRRRAIIADNIVLERVGAASTVTDTSDEMVFRNWRFKVNHTKICNSSDLASLARQLEAVFGGENRSPGLEAGDSPESDEDKFEVNGQKLHLPPMLFLEDVVCIAHSVTDTCVNWNARDCLYTWVQGHSENYQRCRPLRIVQVPYAHVWKSRNAAIMASSSQVSRNPAEPIQTTVAPLTAKLWDWTFTSDYMCSVGGSAQPNMHSEHPFQDSHIFSAFLLSKQFSGASDCPLDGVFGSERAKWRWERAEVSGLDLDMLKSVEDPILFFDETTLYQVST